MGTYADTTITGIDVITDQNGDNRFNGNLKTEVDTSTLAVLYDITGIPLGVNTVKILLNEVSVSGTSDLVIRIGDAGGIESTGYRMSGADVDSTPSGFSISTGFEFAAVDGASNLFTGIVTLERQNSAAFRWVISGSVAKTDGNNVNIMAGRKALTADLDRIRLTTEGGSNTFDNGSFSIRFSF